MTIQTDQIRRVLTSVLRIQPGEGPKTALMFGVMACVVGSFVTARVVRDTLFLSRNAITTLPYLYIWVAVGISLQSYLISQIIDRLRRDRLFIGTQIAVMALFLLSYGLLKCVGSWFLPVLYVLVELEGSLLILQAWTLANDVFTTREAKRLFGLVGTGGVVASAVVGLTIGGLVHSLGTESLLLLCATAMGVCLLLSLRLSKISEAELLSDLGGQRTEIKSRISLAVDWRRLSSSRHLLLVAGLTFLLLTAVNLIDYQFKVTARSSFMGQEDRLAAFLGRFWGLTGLFNIFIQALLTSRILERFGILVSLLLLPISMLCGSVAWIVAPTLWSVSVLKGTDATLRYTINDATIQLLYLPVPGHVRGRAKAFIDGIVRPVAIGITGIGLAWVLPSLGINAFGWILTFLTAGCIGLGFAIHREYLAALLTTLRTRRFGLGADSALVPDQAASQALRRALEDPEEASVLHALDMIADLPLADWADAFQTLTRHPSAQVRSRALRLLGTTGSLDRAPAIHACLRDPEPLVRAAAIDSYCAVGRERAISTVAHFLQNPDPDVKRAAIVGLIRYGGLDGVLSAAEHLKALLRSDQTSERTAGARVLGEIQVRNFYNPLLKLLVDADLGVRQAAIRAAGRMGSPELLPALIYRLECPATRRDAMEALVAYGSSAVRVLQRVLSNPDEALGLRLLCPILLARIGDQASLDALLKELLEPTPDLRSRILEAIHRLRLRRPHLKFDRERLSEATLLECRRLYEQTLLARDLASHPGSLLAEALGRRREASLLRLFRLLAGIYPVRAVDAVLVNLGSESRKNRSNALEVLDNLLTKEIKRLVLPLCDPALADLQRDITAELGLQSAPRADRLKALLMGADRWLAVCAVYEIGIQTERGLAEEVAASIGAADPLLRETALDALAKLLPLDEVRNAAEHHLSDPSREVRALAVRLCAAGPNA